MPPLLRMKIFDKRFFVQHQSVFPMKKIGSVRPKFFDGKTWHPLLRNKIFDTPNFLKHWRDAHENFRHCETEIFDGKRDTHPFPPQNFSKPETFSKTVAFPYEIFRHCETWKLWLKIVICALLSINFFRYQKISGKQKVSFFTKSFVAVLWNKKFLQNLDAFPLSMHENFCWKIFSETPRCSPMNFFRTVRQKFFDGKTWYPLLWKKFSIP